VPQKVTCCGWLEGGSTATDDDGPVILPAWTAAAMLVSLPPEGARTWQEHLQMIWDLEATDGVNYSALTAIYTRYRRLSARLGS
jgi:hypothetical protein